MSSDQFAGARGQAGGEGLAGPDGLASAGGLAGPGGLASAEPFEYALIRVVPRVERGEAMNAGVILYCQQHRYLGCRILLDEDRLRALDPSTDMGTGPRPWAPWRRAAAAARRPGSHRECGSAGLPPRAARSCSRAPCTAA